MINTIAPIIESIFILRFPSSTEQRSTCYPITALLKRLSNHSRMDTIMHLNMRKRKSWLSTALLQKTQAWPKTLSKRIGVGRVRSDWWGFITGWTQKHTLYLKHFQSGAHLFSPRRAYRFTDEIVELWCYLDRLMLHLILTIIKPTFKHLISPTCTHLNGPSSIKKVTQHIQASLQTHRYTHLIRTDIRSYYASINHQILLDLLYKNYDDPILQKYFYDIVTAAVDKDGQLFLPTQGIPLRSSLSPFFGALYLSALDQAFENKPGIFYRRYMDDVIILIKNERLYRKAKKRLFTILRALKLQVSPHKTRMGRLNQGFHFLGVEFVVAQTPQHKTQAKPTIHTRTCRRALDRVQAMRSDAVHPAIKQRYLIHWATWWSNTVGLSRTTLIQQWINHTATQSPSEQWLGRGLIDFK